MAKFLTTSAITYFLEQLISDAEKELYIISPYLRLNQRIRELLQDATSLEKVEIIYGKKDLARTEQSWLDSQPHLICRFCKNLHAKCYLSESEGIITSMNLYEFSQVNNNEMGLLFTRDSDSDAYYDALKEAKRLSRLSRVEPSWRRNKTRSDNKRQHNSPSYRPRNVEDAEFTIAPKRSEITTHSQGSEEKLSTTQLAAHKNVSPDVLFRRLEELAYIKLVNGNWHLTPLGRSYGGKQKYNKRLGAYFVWPIDLRVS